MIMRRMVNIIMPDTPQNTVRQFLDLLALLGLSPSSSSSQYWRVRVQFQPSRRILRTVKGTVMMISMKGDISARIQSWVWLAFIL